MLETTDTPERQVVRQWYQAKLGERLLQAGQMGLDRAMLRRGACKMQDGTLGQQGVKPVSEEDMNIRVGDEVHHHYNPEALEGLPGEGSPKPGLLQKAIPYLVGAAIAGGLNAAWVSSRPTADKPPESPVVTDTDTQYILELVPTK